MEPINITRSEDFGGYTMYEYADFFITCYDDGEVARVYKAELHV